MLPAGSNLSHFCEIGICAAMTASKNTGFKKAGYELSKIKLYCKIKLRILGKNAFWKKKYSKTTKCI